MNKIDIYLAAPLFNPIERSFNEQLADALEPVARTFLPQRDGALLTKLVASGQSVESARRSIYEADISAIKKCHIIVAVLDGRTIDEGVAFEIGYGNALGKICIAYKSDDRVMLPTGDNPMIMGACKKTCSTIEGLIHIIKNMGDSIHKAKLYSKNEFGKDNFLINEPHGL